MKLICERCGFKMIMSKRSFYRDCLGTPYCPKCGKYIDENLEDDFE